MNFMIQRPKASVDVFGRQLTKSVGGSRGLPGEGFKITLDGQYDMDTQAHKKSGMNFTCEYTTPMDFELLNPNPVSEFPLDPPVFP